jgi:hypothetical protein
MQLGIAALNKVKALILQGVSWTLSLPSRNLSGVYDLQ